MNKEIVIKVCTGTGGLAAGGEKVLSSFKKALSSASIDAVFQENCSVQKVGCRGFCAKDVLVDVIVNGARTTYKYVKPDMVERIVKEHIIKGSPITEWAVEDDFYSFHRKQTKVVLSHCGEIDPEDIEAYMSVGGYGSIKKVLTSMTPEETISVIKNSGLRGRGGAGFPTGLKWEICRRKKSNVKYIICNADEGDPGAFMDRAVLEGDPHSVIEGMIIGAYAIGAEEGYVYIRAEYPLAVMRVKKAIQQARERGFLGKNILGKDFNFDIKIKLGAGAFVCGEETALIVSIEGKRGMPRAKPPFPVDSGLWGKPTVINNVETLANIPYIIRKGAEWFSSLGTENSKGTKVFALTGKVKNTGLIEVPFGITLREIIFDIGGGIEGGRMFKAVQTGGPSGGCIPAELLDIEVDYESLAQVGSIVGSGGMVVLDETDCMVNTAKFFLEFTQSESCGKCTPCRVGTKRLLEILERITSGKGQEGDIEFLEELSHYIKTTSLCGLGMTAPNPVLSTIKYFRHEYESHIRQKRCSALVCKEIVSSACQHTCPIGTDVPVYIALIANRRFDEALYVIRKDNPLACVCGRLCHHPCELKCKAGEDGKPLAIRALKRFATEYGVKKVPSLPIQSSWAREQKVAIIGSGPAGLTAGYFLAQKGYDVTIYEAKPVIGGMLKVAIPQYRLPREILDTDINIIKDAGVKFKTDTVLGRDISIDSLFSEGYKAIFIAFGANKPMKMNIAGEDTKSIIPSLKFLEAVNLGKKIRLGRKVGVIGGGNSAVDSARVANRIHETEKVTIIYRRTRSEMPAYKEEVDAAIEEGIEIKFLTAPVKILSQNGKLVGIECIRMKLGEIDQTGRAKPVPIKGSEFTIKLDTLIVAIGEQSDVSFLGKDHGLEISKRNTIIVDTETLATLREGVFAGGDAVTGPGTVIHAISAGKKASESIDRYLRGESLIRSYEATGPSTYIEPVELSDEEIREIEPQEMSHLSPEERVKNFKEVELGFSEEMAVKEARRCLRCELGTTEGQKALREMMKLKKERVSEKVRE